jgi:hypothetical protein
MPGVERRVAGTVVPAQNRPEVPLHKIDEQKFAGQRSWEGRLHAKVKRASTEREVAMSLVIIDDGLVVELRRADTEAVVCIGRSQKKPIILQEGLDQLVIFRRRLPEISLLGKRVESRPQLRERSIVHELPDMPINGIRPPTQIPRR